MTVFLGTTGAMSILAPSKASNFYKVKDSPLITSIVLDTCGTQLSIALQLYLQLFEGVSFHKAVEYSVLPSFLQLVHKFLSGSVASVNDPSAYYLPMLLQILVAYSCLSGSESADSVIKIYGAIVLVHAVSFVASPTKALKFFKVKGPIDGFVRQSTRIMGFAAIGMAMVTAGQLLWDAPATAAAGYYAVASLAALAVTFYNKEVNLPVGAMNAWTVLMALTAYVCLK